MERRNLIIIKEEQTENSVIVISVTVTFVKLILAGLNSEELTLAHSSLLVLIWDKPITAKLTLVVLINQLPQSIHSVELTLY